MPSFPRLLFGLSAAIFGVASFLLPDSEIWQRLHPFGHAFSSVAGWGIAIALVAAGFAIPIRQAARPAAIVLGLIYLFFTLACIEDIVAAPTNPGSYVDIFEQFSVCCGALAIYAATARDSSRYLVFARTARVAFAICALSFAWAQIAFFQYTASLVPSWVPLGGAFWTDLTTLAFALAALALLLDSMATLAMQLTALMLALFGLLVWVPRILTHPATLSNWIEISLNYLIAAAAWSIAELRSTPERT